MPGPNTLARLNIALDAATAAGELTHWQITSCWTFLAAVFRIRIQRIHMFLDLPDPDPLVRGVDPDPDPSIIKQNSKKKSRDSYCFVTSFGLLIFEKRCFFYVPLKINKQKNFFFKLVFVCVLKVSNEMAGSGSASESISQRLNVMDPEHCLAVLASFIYVPVLSPELHLSSI